jgi:hypothetical protein
MNKSFESLNGLLAKLTAISSHPIYFVLQYQLMLGKRKYKTTEYRPKYKLLCKVKANIC